MTRDELLNAQVIAVAVAKALRAVADDFDALAATPANPVTPTVGCPACGDDMVETHGSDVTYLSCFGCGYQQPEEPQRTAKAYSNTVPGDDGVVVEEGYCMGCNAAPSEQHRAGCPALD